LIAGFGHSRKVVSWHRLQYVGIPSDHKFFAGHSANYESNAFSAVNDKEAARFCSSQNQKKLLPTVDRLKKFIQMLADNLQILVSLARWCLAFLALPVGCRNTMRS
jgi:hypothetical protein